MEIMEITVKGCRGCPFLHRGANNRGKCEAADLWFDLGVNPPDWCPPSPPFCPLLKGTITVRMED